MQTKDIAGDILKSVGSDRLKEEMQRREKEIEVLKRFGDITKHQKKKNNRIVEYYIAYDGRKQITSTTRDGLIEKLYNLLDGEADKNITVEQLFEMYAQRRHEDTSISSRTADFDRPNWNRFFKDDKCKLKTMKVVDVTTPAILLEYKRIVGYGERTKKDFGKATSLLNGVFDLAVEMEIVQSNLARSVLPLTKKFKFAMEKDHSNDVWTKEERDKLVEYINTLPQTRYTLAIRLAACFPLRVGELRALMWEDFLENEMKLRIHHEIVKIRKGNKKSCDADVPFPKGGQDSGCRKIPVLDEAEQILKELRAINGGKKYILNGEGNAAFSISTNKINEHLRKYCEGAGVPYYSSHQFRFYGATRLFAENVSLNTIRNYLGHSTLQMTLHYLRPDIEDVDEETLKKVFGRSNKVKQA
ncbi:MAG: site-specific integrase [Acetatifactor sp.]|nr:site-specific integrase [Acetatifactor sp.]